MNKTSIPNWAQDDRPREKLIQKGAGALSNSELIAILIGSGSRDQSAVSLAKQILLSQKNDLQSLAKLTIAELKQYKGIGEAKAVSIAAALELSRRVNDYVAQQRVHISSSADAVAYLAPLLRDKVREEFWIVLMNIRLEVIHAECLFTGTTVSTAIDTKLILKRAIDHLAAQLIIAHNHPSGRVNPSEHDIKLTKKISQAAQLLDLRLADHIIIGNKDHFSFADHGMME